MRNAKSSSGIRRWLVVACLMFAGGLTAQAAESAAPAQQQVEQQQKQPGNNAPVWREVRSGEAFFTTIRTPEAGVLIQSEGNTWRQIRNGPVTLYGGALLLAVIGSILAFY
jgi:formate dehydrogenase subunit gamma